MRTKIVAIPADATIADLRQTVIRQPMQRGQHLFPVIDGQRRLKGAITRKQLRELIDSTAAADASLADVLSEPVVANPDEPLRTVVSRMAETGFTRLPVVESGTRELVGMISLQDLLLARVKNLNEERHRERVLQLRLPFLRRASVSRE